MKTFYVSIFFSFFVQISCAQNLSFDWAKQFAGTTEGAGYAIISDASGNTYTTGFFSGTRDFDPGSAVFNLTAIGTGDIFISKLDSSGNLVWVKQMKGTNYGHANAITLDLMGNIYATGSFTHTVDFDPGPGIFDLSTEGRLNVFILKLDNDGNFIWAKQLVGVAGAPVSTAFSLHVDVAGNVITTGLFAYTVDFDPGPGVFNLSAASGNSIPTFILKLNSNGNFVWAKQIGGTLSKSIGYAVITDAAGNIYTTGYFSADINSTFDFDPGPGIYNLTPVAGVDIFISKLDAAGNFIWARQMGGSLFEEGKSMTIDASGNLYISGYFEATVDFDPGPNVFNLSAFGKKDIFITKLGVDGNFAWAKQIGGTDFDEGKSIALDRIGNIYVAGYFNETVDFDPGNSIYNLTSAGMYDMFILKLDNNGDFKWAKRIGGEFVDGATAIHVDATAHLYATGYFEDLVDFDPGQGVFNLNTSGNKDIFVLKLSLCNNFTFSMINATVCNIYILNGQTYTTSGTYIQTLNNAAGCDSIITLNLTINIKYTSITATICQGQSHFAGGANQRTPGIYKDTLLTSLGCDSIITTTLYVNPKPKPDLGPDRNLCMNTQASITPGVFANYLWQDNSTQPGYTINSPGVYWVKVSDVNNCSATDTLNVISIDTIPKDFLPPNQELCYGQSLRIAVPNYFTYQWSTGSIVDFIDVTTFGKFYLTVKDYNSCTGNDSINIVRKNCFAIGIPNAFTPNGDTKNDIFKPTIFQEVMGFSFVVFNRYGQKIFETTEYGKGWDGSFNGKPQPAGSYVYRIKFTNIFGWESVENGTVLLIR